MNQLHVLTCLCDLREVSQIKKVDVGMNMGVESHPVGRSPPQILIFLLLRTKFCLYFLNFLNSANKKNANVTNSHLWVQMGFVYKTLLGMTVWVTC